MPELKEDLIAKIKASVEDGFDEQIKYTQKLIQFGGQRGQEVAVQDFIHEQFENRGYKPVKFDMDEEALSQHIGAGKFSGTHSRAPIVVGTHEPTTLQGRSLILNGHIDVVPVGPTDLWQHSPYSGDIDGDHLHGRGAGDMRAGHAANLYALDALRRIGLQPAAKVILESVVEEESTGNGTLMTHLKGYKADTVLIPEPMDENLVRAAVGVLWFQVEVKGKPVHVREMSTGGNAIDATWRIIGKLRELEVTKNEQKKGRAHFENEEHPMNLNIAMMHAGDWASSVPAWCRVDCRMSLYPGISAESAAQEIEKTINDFAQEDELLKKIPPTITWNGFYSEGYVLEPGSEAEKALERAHLQASGKDLTTYMSGAYLDTRIYSLYDKIPALGYGPISGNIHGTDEWVSIASVKRVTTAIALFIAAWCGVEKTS